MVTAPDRSRRGAALFVVLLFSAFVAGLAAAAMRTSLSGVRAAAVFADALRADELGRGAGQILAFHLAGGDDAARRGGKIEVRLPDADIVIDYLSESSRIDVNLAPVALLAGLLGAAGSEPDEVSAIADRIARFRAAAAERAKVAERAKSSESAPSAPSASATSAAAFNAAAPVGRLPSPPLAIRDLAEVAHAWGLSGGLARRVLPSLTVANGTSKVDPVLADRLVLTALVGSDERVDDYLARRRQGFVNNDSALELLPVPARAFAAFKDSDAVRALARVTVAHGFERRYEMVLAPRPAPGSLPGRGQPPVVVSWRRLL